MMRRIVVIELASLLTRIVSWFRFNIEIIMPAVLSSSAAALVATALKSNMPYPTPLIVHYIE